MGGGGAVLATATICCSIVINRIISCFGSVFGVQESPPSSSAVSPCARPVGFCRIADRFMRSCSAGNTRAACTRFGCMEEFL